MATIPDRQLEKWYRHLKRLAGHAVAPRGDIRTANALRLARTEDIRQMERHLKGGVALKTDTPKET